MVYLGSDARDSPLEVSAIEYEKARDSHYVLLGSFLGRYVSYVHALKEAINKTY